SLTTALGALMAACQAATPAVPTAAPQVIEKVVTQVVTQQVPVTQVVTQVVEKQVTQLVQTTPAPKSGGTMVIPWWFWEGVQSWSVQRVPRIYMGMLINIDLDGTLVP